MALKKPKTNNIGEKRQRSCCSKDKPKVCPGIPPKGGICICAIYEVNCIMKNNYSYIETFYSELASFNFEGGLQFGATEFNYDFNNIAQKVLGVNVNIIFETKIDEEEKEILKSQSNFVIERNQEISGKELYPLIQHSINAINVFLREKYLLLNIPYLEVPCPLLDEMQYELNELAIDSNRELK